MVDGGGGGGDGDFGEAVERVWERGRQRAEKVGRRRGSVERERGRGGVVGAGAGKMAVTDVWGHLAVACRY